MAGLLGHLRSEMRLLGSVLDTLILTLFPKGPQPMLAAVGYPSSIHLKVKDVPESLLEDPKEEGFLWAVPKHRRSRERRLIRKFGLESKHNKMLPYRKLLTCDSCGHVHEPGRLCPNCYAQNKKVTQAMQEAMVAMQGLNPVEHDALPVFKGEKVNTSDGFLEGKRIFEVPEERPKWFSSRLKVKSNVTTSTDTTVRVGLLSVLSVARLECAGRQHQTSRASEGGWWGAWWLSRPAPPSVTATHPYSSPSFLYPLKVLTFYLLVKFRKRSSRSSEAAGIGIKSRAGQELMECPQALHPSPKAIDAVFFSGAGQGWGVILAMERRPHRLSSVLVYLKVKHFIYSLNL
ncbi:39S ribosomal protein L32, mitochondrial [Chionoecetes opilio]|uniref:Large ribosomal subunit protein bL32m n=1 Tax=Chionoecetes opilio TaxID=41210 RepID=A0A8J4XUS0_CHIOP|nr:39S ribosomal protein L32, mitochondrial [Chionoecetes opilio]